MVFNCKFDNQPPFAFDDIGSRAACLLFVFHRAIEKNGRLLIYEDELENFRTKLKWGRNEFHELYHRTRLIAQVNIFGESAWYWRGSKPPGDVLVSLFRSGKILLTADKWFLHSCKMLHTIYELLVDGFFK
jgi:hypothetical protein